MASTFLRRLCAACAVWAVVVGCGVSPQPQPMMDSVVMVDVDQVEVGHEEATGDDVQLRGRPGAAAAGPGTLRVLNLQRDDGFVLTTLGNDGSFFASVAGTTSDRFRLEAVTGGGRSSPLDIQIVEGNVVPLNDCLRAVPSRVLVVDGEPLESDRVVMVHSDCPADVVISQVAVVGDQVVDPLNVAPLTIGPSQDRELRFHVRGREHTPYLAALILRDAGLARAAVSLESLQK
jgi:hypothetical protein